MNTLKDFVNWKLTHADKTAEAEGYPLTMENCKKNKKMKQLEVYGNSVQDGAPSPENPIEVQSVGDKSVNLFDKDNFVVIAQWNAPQSKVSSTDTGISFVANANVGHVHLKLGLASDYAGKTLALTSTSYYSPSTRLVIRNTSGGAVKSSSTIVNNGNGLYSTILTIEADTYTDEELCFRLYFQEGYAADGAIIEAGSVLEYKNIMVAESDTPVEYEPYGKYKIPVVQRGKNLWDKENYILDTGNEKSMLRYLYPEDYSWLKKGETFTISATIFVSENDTRTNMRLSIETLGTDGKIYNNVKTHYSTKGEEIRASLTYTIPQLDVDINRIYIRFIDYSTNTEKVWDAYAKDIQIELGATAKPYEPYAEPITTNIFLSEPLRKIGDYADYIDFKENKVVRRNREVIPKPEDIGYRYDYSRSGYYIYGIGTFYYDAYIDDFYTWGHILQPEKATHFEAYNYRASEMMAHGEWYFNNISRLCFLLSPEFQASDGVSSTLADIRAWVQSQIDAGTPLKFTYRLKEPTEEPLNIDLPKLNAKTSIIEVDTSLAPSNAKGKYIKK
jgi:hypothetical protein